MTTTFIIITITRPNVHTERERERQTEKQGSIETKSPLALAAGASRAPGPSTPPSMPAPPALGLPCPGPGPKPGGQKRCRDGAQNKMNNLNAIRGQAGAVEQAQHDKTSTKKLYKRPSDSRASSHTHGTVSSNSPFPTVTPSMLVPSV